MILHLVAATGITAAFILMWVFAAVYVPERTEGQGWH